MSEVQDWANTAAGNAVAFDDIDNRDGVARSKVKTNFRAIMAAVKRALSAVTGNGGFSVDAYIPADLIPAIRDGSSVVDLTSYVQAAIAALGSRGILEFGAGQYRFNAVLGTAKIGFHGQGMGRTRFRSFTTGGAVIHHSSDEGTFEFCEHADFSIVGAAGALTDVGIRFGIIPYVVPSELAGRVIMSRVAMQHLDKCVERLSGNIGIHPRDCVFGRANFHFWQQDGTTGGSPSIMHGGCLQIHQGHYSAAQLAHHYMNSATAGTAQVIYDGPVIELNPGFVFFIKAFNDQAGGPAFNINSTWNEGNNTAGSVTIDGVAYAPKWLRATDTAQINVYDTSLGPVTLVNSNVLTERCWIDFCAGNSVDSKSTLVHVNAHTQDYNGERSAMVRSWIMAGRQIGSLAGYARVPHRIGTTRGYAPLQSVDCQTPLNFVGIGGFTTTNVANAGTTFNTAQQAVIPAGATVFTTNFNVPADKYIVAIFAAKVTSGTSFNVNITGGLMIANLGTWASAEWQTMMAYTDTVGLSTGLPASVAFTITSAAGCTAQLGGWALVVFDTRQQAIEFIDSRAFPL